MARRTNRIRKKNRFIAGGNKKVCFLNLARKLRTRQWNERGWRREGDEWMLNTCCCLRPPPTHSFMWDNNGAEQNRGRNNTPQFLVCWFAIANVFYLFQKKKDRVRRTRRVPQCLRYAAALVKDLIDYTRCDQCRANIKIGARPSWIYFPLLICIAQSSPAQPSSQVTPCMGMEKLKFIEMDVLLRVALASAPSCRDLAAGGWGSLAGGHKQNK